MLSIQRLKSELFYDPDSGVFTRVRTGRVIGGLDPVHGYIRIGLDKKLYKAHRLAFFFMESRWPEYIDHINGIRHDNRWANLRECNIQANNRNTALRSDNSSGVCGVSWAKARNKWRAYIIIDKKQYSLGYFSSKESAGLAATKARENSFGHFAPSLSRGK